MNGTTNQALVAPSGNADANRSVALRDPKPVVELPQTLGWLLWIASGLAIALAAYFLWKRWKNGRAAQTPEHSPTPPHVKARHKLLLAEDLIENPEPFCVAVSEAVRTYLDERFDLHAPDRTTEEFLGELQTNPVLQSEHQLLLGEFLELCDLVKFARFEPQIKKLRELLGLAHRLVDETEPASTDEGNLKSKEREADSPPAPASSPNEKGGSMAQ